MNKVEGVVKEATGKLKEKVGDAMGDARMRHRGTPRKSAERSKEGRRHQESL
jgi:uncharacterized protein YjbJ (UPF0337 family)